MPEPIQGEIIGSAHLRCLEPEPDDPGPAYILDPAEFAASRAKRTALATVTAPLAIEAIADAFLADRRAAGLSLRTVEWYRDTLRREFLPWCS